MNNPVKFLFGESFDESEIDEEALAAEEIRDKLRAEFEVELEKAKKEAFAEGMTAGEQKAQEANEITLKASTDRMNDSVLQLNVTIQELLNNYHGLRSAFTRQTEQYREEVVKLAVATAEKLSMEFVRRHPLEDLERVFRETLNYTSNEIKVSVSVPSEILEEARRRAKEVAEEQGYGGRLIVLSDEELPLGDWQIEWSTGGVIRNMDEVKASIDAVVQNYLQGVEVNLELNSEAEENTEGASTEGEPQNDDQEAGDSA